MRARIDTLLGCLSFFGCVALAQTPVVTPGGIVSAAGLGHTTTIAPGSLISIFGSSLASSLSQAGSATLSTTLGDVDSVTINGVPAPLRFVSAGQINAQAPWETIPGQANVIVTRSGLSSQPAIAQVNPFSPALYGFNLGTPQAVAVNVDGSVAAPIAAIIGLTSHPAAAGDTVTFYASGLGPLDKAPPPNGVNSLDTLRQTSTQLTALVGGVPGLVVFSGLSPQFTGVYQVNVVMPDGVMPGESVPVQLMIGGVTSADTLTIALQ